MIPVKDRNDPLKQHRTPPKGEPDVLDGLPNKPTKQAADPIALRYLLIAPPGHSKTEWFAQFPGALMLACEEGHKFVECFKIIIDSWVSSDNWEDADGNAHKSFMDVVGLLQESDRFPFIIIDTVDALIKMCIDHHLETVKSRSKNIGQDDAEHISDLGDFGKGYDLAMNEPMRQAINAILKTGRGIGFITHQAMNQYDVKGNLKKAKKETTLPNGIIKLLFPQCDIILHGEFGEKQEGNTYRDRIYRAEGSEELLAKNRGGLLPPAFIVPFDLKARWEQFNGFFDRDPVKRKKNFDAALAEYDEKYERPS